VSVYLSASLDKDESSALRQWKHEETGQNAGEAIPSSLTVQVDDTGQTAWPEIQRAKHDSCFP
jgi:hypothetical protein